MSIRYYISQSFVSNHYSIHFNIFIFRKIDLPIKYIHLFVLILLLATLAGEDGNLIRAPNEPPEHIEPIRGEVEKYTEGLRFLESLIRAPDETPEHIENLPKISVSTGYNDTELPYWSQKQFEQALGGKWTDKTGIHPWNMTEWRGIGELHKLSKSIAAMNQLPKIYIGDLLQNRRREGEGA